MEKRITATIHKIGLMQEKAPLFGCEVAGIALLDKERAECFVTGEEEKVKALFAKCEYTENQ